MNKTLIGAVCAVALCVAGTQSVFAAGEVVGAGDKSEMIDKGAVHDKSKAKLKHKKKSKAKAQAKHADKVKEDSDKK